MRHVQMLTLNVKNFFFYQCMCFHGCTLVKQLGKVRAQSLYNLVLFTGGMDALQLTAGRVHPAPRDSL